MVGPLSDALVLTLAKSADPAALEALRHEVATANARDIVVDIDDVAVLDAPVISTLVQILRDARERGTTIALRAGRKSILATLRITALDKVFTVVTAEAKPSPRPPKASSPARHRRIVAALTVGLLSLGRLFGAPAVAQSEAPEDLVARVISQNADMRSYQARVAIDFKLRSFPYISQHLDGTTYYKRPDNFEVVFEKVPTYAKGFDKLYSDIDDPTSWAKRFDISRVGERVVDGHRDVVVKLVQKVRGQIDHEDVAIDPVRDRIDAMTWYYYNGGTISMSQEFERIGSFEVLAKQHATIKIPFVHASAEAVYRDYKTNVAIDDTVFTRKQQQ